MSGITVHCQDCGKELNRNAKARGITHCKPCNTKIRAAETMQRRLDQIEDAEWLISMGESWWEAARRVGTTVRGMVQVYERTGNKAPDDLKALLYAENFKHREKGVCEGCGGETCKTIYTLCSSCRYWFNKEMAA